MSTHSLDGREWAKLSALKPGDKVQTDNGFSCMNTKTLTVDVDEAGLYVPCDYGRHYLKGQVLRDGDHLIGIWPA